MKKLNLILLSFFLLLPALVAKAENNNELIAGLKEGVKELNDECPIDCGDGVLMTEVKLVSETLIMAFNLDMELPDTPETRDIFKNVFMETIKSDESVQTLFSFLKEVGYNFQINVNYIGGNWKFMWKSSEL